MGSLRAEDAGEGRRKCGVRSARCGVRIRYGDTRDVVSTGFESAEDAAVGGLGAGDLHESLRGVKVAEERRKCGAAPLWVALVRIMARDSAVIAPFGPETRAY